MNRSRPEMYDNSRCFYCGEDIKYNPKLPKEDNLIMAMGILEQGRRRRYYKSGHIVCYRKRLEALNIERLKGILGAVDKAVQGMDERGKRCDKEVRYFPKA